MSFRRFRKNRSVSQPVALNASAFNDSRDFIREPLLIAGEAFSPSTGLPVPRDGVRRLSRLDYIGSGVPVSPLRGYGARQPHIASVVSRGRSPLIRLAPVARGVSLVTPLQAQRRKDSWRAFQVLQVRVPSRLKFCVQRLQRRQVLFASKVAGRSGGSPGPYRRSENSAWRC